MKASLEAIGKSSSFGQGSLSGWLGGKAIEAAVKDMGGAEVTRAGLASELHKATLSVDGIPVPLALPSGSPPGGYDGLANPSAYVNQWEGDNLKQVTLVKNVFSSAN
jgi:hypothetical protein